MENVELRKRCEDEATVVRPMTPRLESQEQMMQVHALPGIPDKSPLQLRSSPSPATKDAKMDSDSDVDFVDLESPKRETWSTVTAASLRESASPSGPYFQDKSSPLRLPVPEAFSPPEPASSAASRYLRVPEASPSLRSCTPRSQSTSKRSHASKSSKSNKVVEEEESEDNATFLLMLDVVPAMVIFASSIVAGVSADVDPSNFAWTVCEILFAIFFMGEMVVKIKVFGLKGYFWGDDWYWSWFDLLCVILALIEMTITFVSLAAGKKAEMGAMASLKMLKLARLGRIIRLLKFKIFQELKLMIQGVFTGLRVLFWAVVLLIGCVYLLGVVTRLLFWDKPEFSSVPRAMFTSFRCFTDGCSSYEGAPLQEILFRDWGFGFMLVYILLFLFVTIGIFNLIMAVFIDNVTDGSTKKRQQELGLNAPRTGWILASELRRLNRAKDPSGRSQSQRDHRDGSKYRWSRHLWRATLARTAGIQDIPGKSATPTRNVWISTSHQCRIRGIHREDQGGDGQPKGCRYTWRIQSLAFKWEKIVGNADWSGDWFILQVRFVWCSRCRPQWRIRVWRDDRWFVEMPRASLQDGYHRHSAQDKLACTHDGTSLWEAWYWWRSLIELGCVGLHLQSRVAMFQGVWRLHFFRHQQNLVHQKTLRRADQWEVFVLWSRSVVAVSQRHHQWQDCSITFFGSFLASLYEIWYLIWDTYVYVYVYI